MYFFQSFSELIHKYQARYKKHETNQSAIHKQPPNNDQAFIKTASCFCTFSTRRWPSGRPTTSSPWLGVTYDASKFVATKVGSMVIDFRDANTATITYTVGTVTQTKMIVRQAF